MNWLRRLPGWQPAAPGLEWSLWRRLPALFVAGTALLGAVALALWLRAPPHDAAVEDAVLLLSLYRVAGALALYWTLLLTLAFGCAIVLIMKGPAYGADDYPLPQRDDDNA